MSERSTDPFADLGLTRDADAGQVRAARRRLAKDHHPDAGGDATMMAWVNAVARDALAAIEQRRPGVEPGPDSVPEPPPGRAAAGSDETMSSRVTTDVPSFTVEALPVDTFEALLVVAGWIGDLLDDDPPYRLDVHLHEPAPCWCRLDLVPDAGSATVTLAVAAVDGGPVPDVEQVRDTWIAHLNQLDWS